jgi:hypothetical protein
MRLHPDHKKDLLAFLWINLLALAIYGPWLHLRLVQDDWTLVAGDAIFNRSRWFFWQHDRPLDGLAFKLIHSIFGLNLVAYYLIDFLLVVGYIFILYKLIGHFFPQNRLFALLVALLALAFPANFTTTWITMINNHLSWLLTLLGMWLLILYAEHGGIWRLLMANLLMFIPLWIYEGSLGIVCAWSIFAAFWFIKNTTSPPYKISRIFPQIRFWGTLSPFLGMALFSVLRIWIRPMQGLVGKNTPVFFHNMNITILLQRLSKLWIMISAWVRPLADYWRISSWTISTIFWLVILILVTLTIMLLVFLVEKKYFQTVHTSRDNNELLPDRHQLMWLILIGFGFTLAGYFPSILIRPPNLDDISTRINLIPISGAALMIVSLICLVISPLVQRGGSWKILLCAGIIPLLLLGSLDQALVQQRWNEAWKIQKSIWQQLFNLAPDFKDDTTVVFVIKGYRSLTYGEHPPLYSDWEVDDALRVLYENHFLNAAIIFPNADIFSESFMKRTGIFDFRQRKTIPYEKVIIYLVQPDSNQLQLVGNVKSQLNFFRPTIGYAPELRLIPADKLIWKYRYLVR